VLRGIGWMRLSALRLPLFAGGESILALWLAKLGRDRVARMILCVVIAGLDPAIHAERRFTEIRRTVLFAALQHRPPGQARW
jgi:hypothetical protein